MTTKHYKLSEFAAMLNVSTKTLQRWDREGILKAKRTPTNRRYYTHEQFIEYTNTNRGVRNEKSD